MTEILFASRKGGTGKSTLCAMVANHLALSGKAIAVIDCDNCNTLTWKRKADKRNLFESEVSRYPIISYEDYCGSEEKYEEYDYLLFDNQAIVSEGLPGILVIPFIYSEMVLDSTFKFIKDLRTRGHEKIVFVPYEVNGYKQAIKKKDTIETINWILGIFGKIMPKVSYSRVMEQISTIRNTVEQNILIKDFINELLPDCPMKEEELVSRMGVEESDDGMALESAETVNTNKSEEKE